MKEFSFPLAMVYQGRQILELQLQILGILKLLDECFESKNYM